VADKCDFTYRPGAERLIHVDVDVDVIDVIVVEIIAGGVGGGGVVVARVMIRMIAIAVVLAVLVQHHRGEHVGRAARGRIFQESFRDSLARVSSHDSNRPPRPTELEYGNSFDTSRISRKKHERIACLLDTRRPSNFLQPSAVQADVSRGVCKEEAGGILRFDVPLIAKKFSEQRSSSVRPARAWKSRPSTRERRDKSRFPRSCGSCEKLGSLAGAAHERGRFSTLRRNTNLIVHRLRNSRSRCTADLGAVRIRRERTSFGRPKRLIEETVETATEAGIA